jgi:hypothetical protein
MKLEEGQSNGHPRVVHCRGVAAMLLKELCVVPMLPWRGAYQLRCSWDIPPPS